MRRHGHCLAVAAALAAGAAQAAEPPKTLRIGVVAPTAAANAMPGLAAIRRAYNHATGLPVRVFVARDMAALAEAQAAGRVHYAAYSAAGFAAAEALCGCVEPLAAPVGSAGDTGLRAVIYARAGGPAELVEASRGRIVAGPAGTVGPHVLALDALEEQGAGFDIMHAPSQSEAEAAFAEGRADVLVGWEQAGGDAASAAAGSPARLAALGLQPDEYGVLWRSPVVRYGPHAVRADLPAEVKSSLRNFLLHLGAQQPAIYDLVERRHLGGFVAVSSVDYEAAGRMVALAAE